LKTLWALVVTLIGVPLTAEAGVVYDFTVRSRDQPANSPAISKYFVQDGKVRVGAPTAKTAYVFKDRIMYVIDNPNKSVDVMKNATLARVAAHYTGVLKQLEDAAAHAPPDQRAAADSKVASMKVINERVQRHVVRDYRMTGRIETFDGHECRFWEEREGDAKRLELCITPVAGVPGGAELLNGLKTLSQFRQGSNFAFGVEFGLAEWWSDFASFGGLPILIREFKYDLPVTEISLTGIHPDNASAALLEIPDGYRVQDAPDYAQWSVR
jgi:hypothetical protein